MSAWLLHTRRGRVALLAPLLAAVAAVLVWRAPDLHVVGNAFTEVAWAWVAAAIGANLLSVASRAYAWRVVLGQALPPPHPSRRHVFSAFCVGLLGNAILPGRVGDVGRAAVLTRHVPHRSSNWPALFGASFAHRLFDVPATVALVCYVLATARIPSWAVPGVEIVLGISLALFVGAAALAWRHRLREHQGGSALGRVRRLWHMAVAGLGILRAPGPAAATAVLQVLGWTAQLVAIYFTFRAFQIEASLAAAGLVLLVASVALAFPLWPGSVGLFQAGVALALVPYGVAYQHGFAYGIGLQAIDVAVGVGLGLVFLAREGISFAMLKQIRRVTPGDVEEGLEELDAEARSAGRPAPRAEARVSSRAGV
ncbi:MAG: flippase-like domain-containing protein [Thermoleophilia bacterium]|nr:flippase-like domain-containing protein [Thermoleophilia bacterium]